ncbi:hypothetical protein J3E74DRAFT_23829 [Bipolaris maydis]|nr:hypothetical protein J3E74DRAFT_23829 [Bipolaris maydis]
MTLLLGNHTLHTAFLGLPPPTLLWTCLLLLPLLPLRQHPYLLPGPFFLTYSNGTLSLLELPARQPTPSRSARDIRKEILDWKRKSPKQQCR